MSKVFKLPKCSEVIVFERVPKTAPYCRSYRSQQSHATFNVFNVFRRSLTKRETHSSHRNHTKNLGFVDPGSNIHEMSSILCVVRFEEGRDKQSCSRCVDAKLSSDSCESLQLCRLHVRLYAFTCFCSELGSV